MKEYLKIILVVFFNLLMVFALIYSGMKIVEEVSKVGLKSIVESVWEGNNE